MAKRTTACPNSPTKNTRNTGSSTLAIRPDAGSRQECDASKPMASASHQEIRTAKQPISISASYGWTASIPSAPPRSDAWHELKRRGIRLACRMSCAAMPYSTLKSAKTERRSPRILSSLTMRNVLSSSIAIPSKSASITPSTLSGSCCV